MGFLIDSEPVIDGNGRRNRLAVYLLRFKLYLSCRRNGLFRKSVRQTPYGYDASHLARSQQRNLQNNTSSDLVRPRRIRVSRPRFRDDTVRARNLCHRCRRGAATATSSVTVTDAVPSTAAIARTTAASDTRSS